MPTGQPTGQPTGVIKIPATGAYILAPSEQLCNYLASNNYPAQKYIYVNGYLYSLNKVAAPNSTFITF